MSNKELLSFITRLEELMIGAATHVVQIQDVDEEYKKVYYKVAAELDRRDVNNPNPYSSLWDFYSYWDEELPSYQSRRKHVREIYKEIEDKLNLALEKQKQAQETLSKGDEVFALELSDLHEDLLVKCEGSFKSGNYDHCVFDALKLLESRVREKAEMSDSDVGVELMHKVFDPKQTKFSIAEDSGEVNGWRNLFAGSMGALKNPQSHRFEDVTQHEAFLVLSFVSFMLDFVNDLQKEPEVDNLEQGAEINPDDITF